MGALDWDERAERAMYIDVMVDGEDGEWIVQRFEARETLVNIIVGVAVESDC